MKPKSIDHVIFEIEKFFKSHDRLQINQFDFRRVLVYKGVPETMQDKYIELGFEFESGKKLYCLGHVKED